MSKIALTITGLVVGFVLGFVTFFVTYSTRDLNIKLAAQNQEGNSVIVIGYDDDLPEKHNFASSSSGAERMGGWKVVTVSSKEKAEQALKKALKTLEP